MRRERDAIKGGGEEEEVTPSRVDTSLPWPGTNKERRATGTNSESQRRLLRPLCFRREPGTGADSASERPGD